MEYNQYDNDKKGDDIKINNNEELKSEDKNKEKDSENIHKKEEKKIQKKI